MADLGGGLRLLDHAGAQLVGGHPRLEQLDRYLDPELLIGGLVHVGHAAPADVLQYCVPPGDDPTDEVVLDGLVALWIEVADREEVGWAALSAGAGHRGGLR